MPGKYAAAGLAIVIDALIIAIAIAVVALLYWLVTGAGGDYMAILSDVLFFAGGVILTFGAFVAFFKVGKTRELRKLMLNPLRPLALRGAVLNVGEDNHGEGEQEAGWLLIFVGAALIVISFITSIGYLI